MINIREFYYWVAENYESVLKEFFELKYPNIMEEEEFVQTGNGTVAQRLRELEEEE